MPLSNLAKNIGLTIEGFSTPASGGVPLNTNGSSGNAQTFHAAPLVLDAVRGSGNAYAKFHLTLAGPDSGSHPGNMNLVLTGALPNATALLPLTVDANPGVQAGAPLFIRGDGTTDGALPAQKGMNLFLRRAPADAIPLFLQGPGTSLPSGVPLTTVGSLPAVSGVPLVINAKGVGASGLPLFTSGF